MTRFTKTHLTTATILFLFVANIQAQVGKDSGLWKWTEKDAPHHQAIVQVSAGEGTGTGVIIDINTDKRIANGHEGYCLTAWHVIQDNISDNSIKVHFRNGRRAKGCRVVEYDTERDIAILWVWVPDEIKPAKLAVNPISGGDELEFAGLGGGSDLQSHLRHFTAKASPPSGMERIFADVPLLPGDSGGPVFNQKHELVGIISGGWFWWDGGITTAEGNHIKTTWPARASNVEPIKELIAKVDEEESTNTSNR